MNRGKSVLLNDRVIHERVRLLILTTLASCEEEELVFRELQDTLELTAGNLSVQIKTLEKAQYVKVRKEFVDNKPRTTVAVTARGRQALESYLCEMEKLILNLRPNVNKTENGCKNGRRKGS